MLAACRGQVILEMIRDRRAVRAVSIADLRLSVAPASRIVSKAMLPLLLAFLLLGLLLPAAHAAEGPKELTIPLNEKLLQRFDALTVRLGAELMTDKALRKDYEAAPKTVPAKGMPITFETWGDAIARRHPRLAAALAADGWKVGDFYGALFTLIGSYVGMDSYDPRHEPTDETGRNVAFVAAHKKQVETALGRLPQD